MPAAKADLFDTLKALLAPYAKHFHVAHDEPDYYGLDEELPHHFTLFAHVTRERVGVKFYFWPLHVFPQLKLPASLDAKRLKSARTVLKLDNITTAERNALSATIGRAWKLIAARRKANPTKPYSHR